MDSLWEDIEYALMDRAINVTFSGKWRATITINDTTFYGTGLTPGMAVDQLCSVIVRHKEINPDFIIARTDVEHYTPNVPQRSYDDTARHD